MDSERLELLQTAFESSFDGIFIAQPDGTIDAVNPQACRMLGRSEDEIRELGRNGLAEPTDTRWAEAVEQRRVTGQFLGELNFLRKDNSILTAEVFSKIIYDRLGVARSIIWARDITKRKQTEIELQLLRGQLEKQVDERTRELQGTNELLGAEIDRHRYTVEILNRTVAELKEAQRLGNVGSWEWEVQEDRITWSAQLFRIFGRDARYGEPDYAENLKYYTESSQKILQNAVARALNSAESYSLELEILRADGNSRWIVSNGEPVCDDHNKVIKLRGIAHDITDRKTVELRLEQAKKQLRELWRELVQVQEEERHRIAAALHDLIGQNLTALGLALDHIRSMLAGNVSPQLSGSLDRIDHMVEEAIGAARTLMVELRPPILDDCGLVAALHSYVTRMEEATGVSVLVHAAPSLGRLDSEIELTLFRVAQEALTNAIKHSKARIVRIALGRQAGVVTMGVEDDGTGFGEVRERTPGSGWGLPIMRERILALGGSLRVETSPGKGSKLIFRVPLDYADQSPPG